MAGLWIEIGRQLKQARLVAGLSLDELQSRTEVSRRDLAALEEGDFNRLPSPFYVRSYLRSYASQVGLEPTPLLRKYRATEQSFLSACEGWRKVDPSTNETTGMKNQDPSYRQGGMETSRRERLSNAHSRKTGGNRPIENVKPQQRSHLTPAPLGNYNWRDFLDPSELTTPPSTSEPQEKTSLHTADSQSGRTKPQERRSNPFLSRKVQIAILGAALFIPVALWASGILSQKKVEQAGTTTGSRQNPHAEVQAFLPEGMVLISREDGKSTYELKNNQDLVLDIKANGKCWIQIKEHKDGGYLKDITLDKGDPSFRFTHAKQVTTDLWIFLGSPENVEIQANGQPFNPSDVIHIKKVQ